MFCDLWLNACEASANGKQVSKGAMTMNFEALEQYPLEAIKSGLRLNSQRNKFAPTVADIVEIISDHMHSKHIGPEEAWAIALESFDEYATVVLTQEILEARVIASDIYHDGDKVAARMAFKEVYSRIIKTANQPMWSVSEGFDPARRSDAVIAAVQQGRLSVGTDSKYRLDEPTVTVAGLIENAHTRTGKVSPLAELGAIKSMLLAPDDDGIARRQRERESFEEHRKNELEKVSRALPQRVIESDTS